MNTSRLKWLLVLAPPGYLWFRLINNLRVEWATNLAYSYGWLVPFLCLVFILQRWQTVQSGPIQRPGSSGRVTASYWRWGVLLCALLALLYLPTHLVEEATPEWRPIQWALGIEAIGLTLGAIYLAKGGGWLRLTAFPLCYFFVAIPWPTLIETPVVQSLTRINSSVVVELLACAGIPAIQHGNLIEVGKGTVGVSEACSGIRSFQTSLMVSLFFGEFYEMGIWRRLVLIPAGFVLAMAFNVCRMTFLTVVAADKGIAAIAQYHDPAGIMIAIFCIIALGVVATLMRKKTKEGTAQEKKGDEKTGAIQPESEAALAANLDSRGAHPASSRAGSLPNGLAWISLSLVCWLSFVEAGTELWYRGLESHAPPSPRWSLHFPTNNPTFQAIPITTETEGLLRYDSGEQGSWVSADGFRFKAFYFTWKPGRVAGYLAKRHTPEICLPATGCRMVSGPELTLTNINGVVLPLRSYEFESDYGTLYVFHCRWEAGVNTDAYVTHESARFNLIRGIWAGRGKSGQKIVEFIISGCADLGQAQTALMQQLRSLIKVEAPDRGGGSAPVAEHNG